MIQHDIKDCPRCGGEHKGLDFRPFTRPSALFNWYASCPENGEPIPVRLQIQFTDKHGAKANATCARCGNQIEKAWRNGSGDDRYYCSQECAARGFWSVDLHMVIESVSEGG